jgi:hypothetical protein
MFLAIGEKGSSCQARDCCPPLLEKEQKYEALKPLVTILVYEQIITLTEGSLAGLKFTPTKIPSLVFVAGGICLYLLIMYVFDLYRDWSIRLFAKLPSYKTDIKALEDKAKQLELERNAQVSSKIKQANELIKRRLEKQQSLKQRFPG